MNQEININVNEQKPLYDETHDYHQVYIKAKAKSKAEGVKLRKWKDMLKTYHVGNPEEWVECRLCGMRASSLIGRHLSTAHDINLEKYKEMFPGAETISEVRLKGMSDRMKGYKNIGAGHGGRLSPYSMNFTGYDGMSEEDKKIKIKALNATAKQTMIDNDNNPTSIEYYIKRGMAEDEAKEALSNRQRTFTLEKCIAEHGEEEGRKVWQARQDKWMASLDAKSDEEKAEINKKKIYRGGMTSGAEKLLVEEIKKHIPDIDTQFIIRRTDDKLKYYSYDIFYNGNIVEYNGDFWHASPKKYKESDIPKFPGNKYTAKEIWTKDALKHSTAINAGYKLLVIWESEYKTNKKESLAKCIDFLKS